MRGSGVRGLFATGGRRAVAGPEAFEPAQQLGAHAGGGLLRQMRKTGDQQRRHMLAANFDRTGAFPFNPHVFADIVEIDTHVIRPAACALHQTPEGIVGNPAQFRDGIRVVPRLGHGVRIQPCRDLLAIVEDRHRPKESGWQRRPHFTRSARRAALPGARSVERPDQDSPCCRTSQSGGSEPFVPRVPRRQTRRLT